jgi:CxxC-x17-CxxC domain-containing protein
MGNFNRDDRRPGGGGFNRSFGGGRPSGGNRFGGGSRFGGRDGGRPEMHKAICSECGSSCELPFRPSGDRPVFCSNCFEKQGGGSERPNRFGGDRPERRERPRFDDKQMHEAVCGKCGKTCEVPFKPMAGKPVYCTDCFEKPGAKEANELMAQVKMLNSKIDRLIKILDPNAPVEKVEKIDFKKEVTAKAVVKEEKSKAKIATKKVVAKKKK